MSLMLGGRSSELVCIVFLGLLTCIFFAVSSVLVNRDGGGRGEGRGALPLARGPYLGKVGFRPATEADVAASPSSGVLL